jgi:putative transposase
MNTNTLTYHGYRFPPDVISHAVWLYHRFCLSFRDVEDLLAERGIIVSYETVRQWSEVRHRVRPDTQAKTGPLG